MTELDTCSSAPGGGRHRSCPHPWCTTDHGTTSHPDDEVHRSDGVAVLVVTRDAGDISGAHPVEAEIGVLRGSEDDETWLVIETGAEAVLTVTIESARRLLGALRSDPELRRVLDEG